MRVNRAKRRLLAWQRYLTQTGSQAASNGGIYRGHAKAYADVMYARRYAPIGVRQPYMPPWYVR